MKLLFTAVTIRSLQENNSTYMCVASHGDVSTRTDWQKASNLQHFSFPGRTDGTLGCR